MTLVYLIFFQCNMKTKWPKEQLLIIFLWSVGFIFFISFIQNIIVHTVYSILKYQVLYEQNRSSNLGWVG